MDWITRQHRKIDRVVCLWLVRNFVDKDAVFHYVPKVQVFEIAMQLGGIPYNIEAAKYSHYGDWCRCDYILKSMV